jgi:hypothetical protein
MVTIQPLMNQNGACAECKQNAGADSTVRVTFPFVFYTLLFLPIASNSWLRRHVLV